MARIEREKIEDAEVKLLNNAIKLLSDGVTDQSDAIKNVQFAKFYQEMYNKYNEELKDLGIKEENPPLPPGDQSTSK